MEDTRPRALYPIDNQYLEIKASVSKTVHKSRMEAPAPVSKHSSSDYHKDGNMYAFGEKLFFSS